MRYWEQMADKYGFGDGAAVPDGADVYRAVYIRVMNCLLEKHRSDYRVVAYNRPGVHNSCLWVRVPIETYRALKTETILTGNYKGSLETLVTSSPEPRPDEAWIRAEHEAMELDVDSYITVTVTVGEEQLRADLAAGFENLNSKEQK